MSDTNTPTAGWAWPGLGPGPVTLRVSVIDRCQNRCVYCIPAGGVELFAHRDILRYEEILRLVKLLRDRPGLGKVHLTGGEPLLRRGLGELVRMLAEAGVDDIALTTNGLALAQMAAELKRAGLRRVNVSIDTLRPATYTKLTGNTIVDGPAKISRGIDAALAAGLAVKLNAIMLRGLNDTEAGALVRFAISRGLTLRFIELMPFGPAADSHEQLFVSSAETLENLRRDATLQCESLQPIAPKPGSSARPFSLKTADGLAGRIGVISSTTQPFCRECNRVRLTAAGNLIGCLARSSKGVNIRGLLRDNTDEQRVSQKIRQAVQNVLTHKRTNKNFDQARNMAQVGG